MLEISDIYSIMSLQDLAAAPRFRGAVERFSGEVLSGWCIDAENPLRPVQLQIYFDDVLVGTTVTSTFRGDVANQVRLPIAVGFAFDFSAVASQQLALLVTRLGEASLQEAPTFAAISVRPVGFDRILPFVPDFEPPADWLDRLAATVDRQFREVSGNARIQERQNLSARFPVKAPKSTEDVRLVAFYLPQFHPIPENDEWWGEGFTEWTNVSTASAWFEGHEQPKIPADLGFYDLRVADVHRRQVELAKEYGISAFCYYYYWFSGTNLLTMPLDRHLKEDLDLDFCICWANENWSRRWDGSEHDLLMKQQHSFSDDVDVIDRLMPYFKSDRYIKIDGAPLLVVYRLSLLADPARTIAIWKEKAKAAGLPGLHVSMAETFGLRDPQNYGADSGCQFPPHNVVAKSLNDEVVTEGSPFKGIVYDYEDLVRTEIRRNSRDYMLFRTAMPGWDNTPRKSNHGNVFHRATPELFATWLATLCAKARRDLPEGSRYVFINAWNEWAEGAYLEPDRRRGRSNLEAVRSALQSHYAVLGEIQAGAADGLANLPGADRAVRLLQTLSRCNALLHDMAVSSSWPPTRLAAMVALPESLAHFVIPDPEGRCRLEMMNGSLLHHHVVLIGRDARIQISGWLYFVKQNLDENTGAYFGLNRIDGGHPDLFAANIYERESRPDVNIFFKLTEDDQLLGFRSMVDLAGVPPGRYRPMALVGSSKKANTMYCATDDKLEIVIG